VTLTINNSGNEILETNETPITKIIKMAHIRLWVLVGNGK
jgi:hypothetical protein